MLLLSGCLNIFSLGAAESSKCEPRREEASLITRVLDFVANRTQYSMDGTVSKRKASGYFTDRMDDSTYREESNVAERSGCIQVFRGATSEAAHTDVSNAKIGANKNSGLVTVDGFDSITGAQDQ